MANKPFEYTIINPLERPKSADINQMQGQAHADVRLLARQLFKGTGFFDDTGAEGFISDSFKVYRQSAIFGIGFIQGIGFQNGVANTSIGSISGLNDEYPYKPLTISDRQVPFPSGYKCEVGYSRYDLVQVRALSGTEQLTNAQPTDILSPSAQTFSSQTVNKTLTFDLTDVDIQYMDTGGTPTAPIVVKKGVPSAFPFLPTAPTVDSGYLAVALIRVYDNTAPLSSSDITDQRALLYAQANLDKVTGVLDVAHGGTGNATLTDNALLVGNGTSAIATLSPGAAGQVVRSNGTSWVSANNYVYSVKNAIAASPIEYILPKVSTSTWVELSALTLNNVNVYTGNIRISLQPASNGLPAQFYIRNESGLGEGDEIQYYLKLIITRDAVSYEHLFYYDTSIGAISAVWQPQINVSGSFSAGDLDFQLLARYDAGGSYTVKAHLNNLALYVTQG